MIFYKIKIILKKAAIILRSIKDIIKKTVSAIVDIPVASPSNPSIKLMAFVMPTTQRIVIGIANIPRSIIPRKGRVIFRSEERRVGKEGRARWSARDEKETIDKG